MRSLTMLLAFTAASIVSSAQIELWSGFTGHSCGGNQHVIIATNPGKCYSAEGFTCWQWLNTEGYTMSIFQDKNCRQGEYFLPGSDNYPHGNYKLYYSYRWNKVGKRSALPEAVSEQIVDGGSTSPLVESSEKPNGTLEARQDGNWPSKGKKITFDGRTFTLGRWIRTAPVLLHETVPTNVLGSVGKKIVAGYKEIFDTANGDNLKVTVQGGSNKAPPEVLVWAWNEAALYANRIQTWSGWEIGLIGVNGDNTGLIKASLDE